MIVELIHRYRHVLTALTTKNDPTVHCQRLLNLHVYSAL